MAIFFKEPYNNYYEKFSKASSLINDAKSISTNAQELSNHTNRIISQLQSSNWKELGIEEITSSILPVLIKRIGIFEENVSKSLEKVCEKSINDLLPKLSQLKESDESYERTLNEYNSLSEPANKFVDNTSQYTSDYASYLDRKSKLESEKNSLSEKIDTLLQQIDSTVKYIKTITVEEVKSSDLAISSDNSSNLNLSDIEKKRLEFIGNVDTDTYTIAANAGRAPQPLRLFYNGKEISAYDQIVLKEGETARITVKLPTTAGRIQYLTRTTADGARGEDGSRIWENYASAHSEPYVNRYDSSTFLHTNNFEWVVTGVRKGETQISQTTFIKTDNFDEIKSMIVLNLKVV